MANPNSPLLAAAIPRNGMIDSPLAYPTKNDTYTYKYT